MSTRPTQDPLIDEIRHALMPGQFFRWDEVSELVEDLEKLLRKLEFLVKTGNSARAVRLYEVMLAGVYAKIEEADDECDLCEQLGISPRDCERVAGMEISKKRWASALKWVEEGIAPDSIMASGKPGGIEVQRPVCPYPQVARYRGTGDERAAASFLCADPMSSGN